MDNGYFEVLLYFTQEITFGNLWNAINEKDKKFVADFLDDFFGNEYFQFVDDLSRFPRIAEDWRIPGIIQNAIIDIKQDKHDFEMIFSELDLLGCQFVEIRMFNLLYTFNEIDQILKLAANTSIRSIELILKFDPQEQVSSYEDIAATHMIIASLIVHSAPESVTSQENVSDKYKLVTFTQRVIDSELHCGIINTRLLNPPTMINFFESKHYNGCLNAKISIDTAGNIKNCPSMVASYGHHRTTRLSDVAQLKSFQTYWNIKKDQIHICRHCEFRYICSDCRAYLQHPEDLLSKPLKCGYDPYLVEWKDWASNPLAEKASKYYGIDPAMATV